MPVVTTGSSRGRGITGCGLVIALAARMAIGASQAMLATQPTDVAGADARSQDGPILTEDWPAGVELVVRDVSGAASGERPMFLASSRNGWNPGDPAMQLSRRWDGAWTILLPKRAAGAGPTEFKMTLGAWEREELDAEGRVIGNRTLPSVAIGELPSDGGAVRVEIAVPRFRDEPAAAPYDPLGPIEATGRVEYVRVRGGGGRAREMERNLLVWFPPGYEVMAEAGHRFSVLYLMDGQNVFDAPPGVPGEWRADETATALITAGKMEPVVIVGVPHAGRYRGDEYLAFGSVPGMEPAADEFLDWMEAVVIPAVEGVALVRAEAAGRAIGGASLGGAISLYASTTRAGVYSKAIVESLPMLGQHSAEGDGPARAFLDSVERWPTRVFVGMGGCEVRAGEPEHGRNVAYRAWAMDLGERMERAGLGEDRVRVVIEEEATHTEAAWAGRLSGALEFVFPVMQSE